LKVRETIFCLMSRMTHQLHIFESKNTLKYYLLGWKCLVCEANHSHPSVGKLKGAWSFTSAVPHVFVCDAHFFTQKKTLFFSLCNIFTKSINRAPIHTVPLYLLGQILGKRHIKTPSPPYGGYIHQQQIF
jgi:hypothetical protein